MAEVGNTTHFVTSGGVLIDGVRVKKSNIDTLGTSDSIILDKDGDTTLNADTDDQLELRLANKVDFNFTYRTFNVLSGSAVAADGSTFLPFIPIAASEKATNSTDATMATYYTEVVVTTGTTTVNVPNGNVKGQLKKLRLITNAGTQANVVLTNPGGTVAFVDVGDFVLVQWDGSNWILLELGNDADGTTAPVYTP
jgi:hypothetical protein